MPPSNAERGTFSIFGYGSLIFSPEHPAAVVARVPATLRGVRRAFNKRSISRFVDHEAGFSAFDDTPADFSRGGRHRALVLGTEDDAQFAMEGVLLVYPGSAREAVLASTDRREGYDATREPLKNGYIRETRRVITDSSERACEVYVSNGDARCALKLADETPLSQRAKILINATPRKPRQGGAAVESRGLHYLEGVRESLHSIGIVDSELEKLAAAVRALPGPWVERVAPARGI